mmetsp:Transcript_12143/g.23066  ORF Transcript_12143/g.23066 Transcript_12143/m.23066 type:complete len:441 (-) Transcript_12143:144-1466(-)
MNPHILQGFDKYRTGGRDVFIAYSMGSFVESQGYPASANSAAYENRDVDSLTTQLYKRTGLVLNLKLRWDSGKGVASVGCVSYVPVLRTVEDVGTVDGVDDTLQVSVLEATAANHSEEFRFVREMFGALKGYKLGLGVAKSSQFAVSSELGGDGYLQCMDEAWENLEHTNKVESGVYPPWTFQNPWERSKLQVPHPQCMEAARTPGDKSACVWLTFATRSALWHWTRQKFLGTDLPYDVCLSMVGEDPECSQWAVAGGASGNCSCAIWPTPVDIEPSSTMPGNVYLRWCPQNETYIDYVPGWPGMFPSTTDRRGWWRIVVILIICFSLVMAGPVLVYYCFMDVMNNDVARFKADEQASSASVALQTIAAYTGYQQTDTAGSQESMGLLDSPTVFQPRDVNLIMQQAKVPREKAVASLKLNNGDVVLSLMSLGAKDDSYHL